jgi:hypothetical protein
MASLDLLGECRSGGTVAWKEYCLIGKDDDRGIFVSTLKCS